MNFLFFIFLKKKSLVYLIQYSNLLTELKKLFAQHLYNSMLIENKDIDDVNLNSEKSFDQLIPAVLISGFGNLVFKKSFLQRNGRINYSYMNEY